MPRNSSISAPEGPVVVLYGQPAHIEAPDQMDTLVQVQAISASLPRQGHAVRPLRMNLRLDEVRDALRTLRPRMVFNLVEALGGHDALLPAAALLLEALGIPYTGARASALAVTSDKPEAKRLLRRWGLPTPDWLVPGQPAGQALPDDRWIVKSVWEHASLGLDDGAVVQGVAAVAPRMAACQARHGGQWFAERYVEGREFNLSLLEQGGRVQLLHPAEMTFRHWQADRPRIVGYAAKWDTSSPEYRNTVRSFRFGPADQALLHRLGEIALGCWEAFGLRGYARVDLRVDAQGQPWVLEVNANPCLSPDAGFAAAAARAGLDYDALVGAVMAAAEPPGMAPATTTSAPRRARRRRAATKSSTGVRAAVAPATGRDVRHPHHS